MASMKSCSHRTFIKGSSMELNFYAKFFYIMKRREKVCFRKLTWKKIEKLSLKRTENYGKVVAIELHRKRKKFGEKWKTFFQVKKHLACLELFSEKPSHQVRSQLAINNEKVVVIELHRTVLLQFFRKRANFFLKKKCYLAIQNFGAKQTTFSAYLVFLNW